jgi:hypothetical protein
MPNPTVSIRAAKSADHGGSGRTPSPQPLGLLGSGLRSIRAEEEWERGPRSASAADHQHDRPGNPEVPAVPLRPPEYGAFRTSPERRARIVPELFRINAAINPAMMITGTELSTVSSSWATHWWKWTRGDMCLRSRVIRARSGTSSPRWSPGLAVEPLRRPPFGYIDNVVKTPCADCCGEVVVRRKMARITAADAAS